MELELQLHSSSFQKKKIKHKEDMRFLLKTHQFKLGVKED